MTLDTADGQSAAGTWLELSVECDSEAVEAISDILSRAAPGGVAIEPAFTLTDDGLGAVPDTTRPATVRAYLPGIDAGAAERAIAEAEANLGHLQAFGLRPIGGLQVRSVHEEDWADAWKQHFPVLRIGRRIVIRPTWQEHDPKPDDVVLALDPGMAFGTGLHPTTRLCLAGVERWADEGIVAGAGALDVGCGSGILAIAAGLLGARHVLGVDTDPIAVDATTQNADRNGLGQVVTARRGSLPLPVTTSERGRADGDGVRAEVHPAVGPEFDLVLANLIASLLVDLAGDLAASIRPGDGTPGSGGRLLASGIFIDREPEVRRAFLAAGLRIRTREQETDWVALEAERPAP